MYEIKDDETGQSLYGNLKKTVTIFIKSREVKLRSFFPGTNMMTSTWWLSENLSKKTKHSFDNKFNQFLF